MSTLLARIVGLNDETRDIRAFELAAAGDDPLPPFEPGSHIDVHVHDGLIRQYSLYNPSKRSPNYHIGVKREPASRGGSEAIYRSYKVGDIIKIGRPRNSFPLISDAQHYLFLAGGIGVTPLLSMAQHLSDHGQQCFRLHYFTRSQSDIAFTKIIEQHLAGKVDQHVGLNPDEVRTRLSRLLAEQPRSCHLYACGPRPFSDLMQTLLSETGWASDRIHFEHFDANPTSAEGSPFKVELARRGLSIDVQGNESIAQALLRHGVDVDLSCEQGICGTCVTRVLAGVPQHLDQYLSDDEKARNDQICICVSRSSGHKLVLDL